MFGEFLLYKEKHYIGYAYLKKKLSCMPHNAYIFQQT